MLVGRVGEAGAAVLAVEANTAGRIPVVAGERGDGRLETVEGRVCCCCCCCCMNVGMSETRKVAPSRRSANRFCCFMDCRSCCDVAASAPPSMLPSALRGAGRGTTVASTPAVSAAAAVVAVLTAAVTDGRTGARGLIRMDLPCHPHSTSLTSKWSHTFIAWTRHTRVCAYHSG